MEALALVLSNAIAVAAAIFALYQAKAAQKAVKQASLIKLFSTFDLASQATIERPDLLQSVHGLDESIPAKEAASIAYLSLLLDGFQHYYGEEFDSDFQRMETALKKQSTFLNRILAVDANQRRWQVLKSVYYGEFDLDFIHAIESLIEYENNKKTDLKTKAKDPDKK